MSILRYRSTSGGDWNKALPIGNGKLGAMIYGEGTLEHFQLNEDSVWFGQKRDRNNRDALQYLPQIREWILNGEIEKAEELCKYALSGTPQCQHSYQTLGDVYFDFGKAMKNSTGFERKLNLDTAIYSSYVTDGENTIYCDTFASYGSNCIAVRFTSEKKGKLDFAASISRSSFYDCTKHTEDSLYFSGNTGGHGIDFCCGMKLISDGTAVHGIGEHLITEKASTVTILISAGTSFRHENPERYVKEVLEAASQISYETLRETHIHEYQSLFRRMRLCLSYDKSLDKLTTEERLSQIGNDAPDNGLINTYMDYGRYLLICSSRGDSLPANLQGLWNKDLDAPWGSKYTININTEMNYWPAGICNLSDCQNPLFDHMLRMLPNGRETARIMYGCKGFTAHHNTDLWGDTAPTDIYIPASYWVMGGAWLSTHIWTHYLYTGDRDFLRKMYPVLKESVRFFMDFLIEVDGNLVTCPSVSPENTYVMENGTRGCLTYGCTMDNEILHELFEHFEKAADVLNEKDFDFRKKAQDCTAKIPPIQIGKHGQIMEWIRDYEEFEPGHRHISHLWALHPAHQITPDKTPELCKAAEVTLKRRLAGGGGHTGWSRAWIMNMYARLWNGNACYDNLLALFQKSTLPNLLDNHPPFQIDGNFGAIAAMAEMLLQSREDCTILLPALPDAWPDGAVYGLCSLDGVRYDLCWRNGLLETATLHAMRETTVTLVYKTNAKKISLSKGENYAETFQE